MRIITRFSNQHVQIKNIISKYWHLLTIDPQVDSFVSSTYAITYNIECKSIHNLIWRIFLCQCLVLWYNLKLFCTFTSVISEGTARMCHCLLRMSPGALGLSPVHLLICMGGHWLGLWKARGMGSIRNFNLIFTMVCDACVQCFPAPVPKYLHTMRLGVECIGSRETRDVTLPEVDA